MLPIACVAVGVAVQVVDLVLIFGRVEEGGIALTAAAFVGLLAALPSEAVIIVLSRAFFAARNTWIPVAAALSAVAVAVSTALLLVGPLGIVGLSLGVVAGSWTETLLLLVAFRVAHSRFSLGRLARAHLWYAATAVAAGLVAERSYHFLAAALPAEPGALPAAAALAGAGIAGLGIYVALAALLRVPELRATVELLRAGLRRGGG
jgi:putative peptidoglycan lipid II flippase